jgi:H2-forming N5,N10-methylenetetrahydromethanopterin dehydrogenase-like enzyme
MPLYLSKFSYTPETWKRLVSNPEDRRAAAQKYIESLKEFAHSSNQKVFFLPVEATSVIASIGGIAELAKDAMQKQTGK